MDHTLAALRAGKHVLAEKPGGTQASEVEAMLREARNASEGVLCAAVAALTVLSTHGWAPRSFLATPRTSL